MNARTGDSYYVPVPGTQDEFRPTTYCGGSWTPDLQHGAPPMSLLVRSLRRLWDASGDDRQAARISFDFLGPIPMDKVRVRATLVRPGKRIELSQAVMEAPAGDGWRPVMVARAWRLPLVDTAEISRLPDTSRVSAPDPKRGIDMAAIWPGGYVQSVEVVQDSQFDSVWVRPTVALVEGERIQPLERVFAVADFSNAFGDAAARESWTFMNVELTAHLLDVPHGEWFNLDATSFVGRAGSGVTSTVLSGPAGPALLLSQELMLTHVQAPVLLPAR